MRNIVLPITLLLLVLCVMLLGTMPAHADEPIPTAPDAITAKHVVEARSKFYQLAVNEYAEKTKDPEKARAAAITFLQQYTGTATAADRNTKELYSLGQAAIEAGSGDPIVRLYLASASMRMGQSDEGKKELDALSVQLKESEYRSYFSQRCEQWRNYWSGQMALRHDDRNLDQKAIDSVVASFQDSHQEEIHRRFVWGALKQLLESMNLKDTKRLESACLAAKGVDPWLRGMLIGLARSRVAWSRYVPIANASAAERKRLRDGMKEAREHYLDAHRLYPQFPEAATEMISVAMTGADDHSPRYWFDQAVSAQMDFGRAYMEYLRSLRPQWGGSYSKIWKFGKECRETNRYDTEVPIKMVQALNVIDFDMHHSGVGWRKPGVYEVCLPVFQGYEKEYGDRSDLKPQHSRDFYRSMFFSVAVRTENHQAARKIIDVLGDDIQEKAYHFAGLRGQLPKDRARIYALTSPSGEKFLQLEKLLADDTLDSAEDVDKQRELLDAEIEEVGEKRADLYYRDLRKKLTAKRAQFDKYWRPLPFDEESGGWTMSLHDNWGKEFVVESPQSMIMVRSKPRRTLVLRNQGLYPPPYMVEVEIESLDAPKGRPRISPGILINKPGRDVAPNGLYQSRHKLFYIEKPVGRVGSYHVPGRVMFRKIPLKTVNLLRVKVWQGHDSFYVNGAMVESKPDKAFSPEQSFGLTIAADDDLTSKVRFKNFRIKPINYGPPPKTTDPDALIAYYTKVIDDNSEEGDAYRRRGDLLFGKKKYAEAAADVEAALKYGVGADEAPAHDRLGYTYDKLGHYKKALIQYRESLRTGRSEDRYIFLTNLAWFLATCPEDELRNGTEALKLAKQALEVYKGKGSSVASALAAAYAETGNFEQAIAFGEKALEAATPQDKEEVQGYLEYYRQKKPYREQLE